MAYINAVPQELVIAIGDTTSTALGGFDDASNITIYVPSTADGSMNFQVSPFATGTDWYTLRTGTLLVSVDVAQAVTITRVSFKRIRAVQSVAAVAARTLYVTTQASRS
jgi:hypothetical protein